METGLSNTGSLSLTRGEPLPKEGSLPLLDLFSQEERFSAKKRGFAEELESSLAGANQVILPNPPVKPICLANHTEAASAADGVQEANQSTVPAASIPGISPESPKEMPALAGQPAFDLATWIPLTPGNNQTLEPGTDFLAQSQSVLTDEALIAFTGNAFAPLTGIPLDATPLTENALDATALTVKALGLTRFLEGALPASMSPENVGGVTKLTENADAVTAMSGNALSASLPQAETVPEVWPATLGPMEKGNWLPEKANVTTGQVLTTSVGPEKAGPATWAPGNLNHLAGAGGQVKGEGPIPIRASPVAEAPEKDALLAPLGTHSPGEANPQVLGALAALSEASVDQGGIQEKENFLGAGKTHETRSDLPGLVGSGLATASEKLTLAKENIPDQVARAILDNQEAVSKGGVTEFHFKLHPPELGTVRVHLTAAGDWVSARLVVHERASFQLLQEHVQSLRQRLCESGVSLGSFNLAWGGNREQGYQSHPYLAPAWSGSTPGFLPDYAEDVGPLRHGTNGVIDVLV